MNEFLCGSGVLLTAKNDPSVVGRSLSNIKRALFTVGVISKHFDIVFEGVNFDEVCLVGSKFSLMI
jgi:hypothetical protein